MNTKNTPSSFATALSLGALSLAITACSPSDQSSADSEADSITAAQFILAEAPTDVLSVFEARQQAKPGEGIQVSGQIGGTLHPFVEGYAAFVLADPELEFCDEMGDDDHCSTPWDACCEDPDKIQSMRMSVQFVDNDGNPIQGDIKQRIGLEELDEVTVVGTVAATSTDSNVIIHASGLYRE